jgi:hypothetical protein
MTKLVAPLNDDQVYKIVRGNAIRILRLDLDADGPTTSTTPGRADG